MKIRLCALGFFCWVMFPAVRGQEFAPPNAKKPDKQTLQTIVERTSRLDRAVVTLSINGVRDPILADIEIYLKAAQWIQKYDEYFHEQSGKWTLDVLDRGLLRAAFASRGESPWLNQAGRSIVRGYRSRVDGSVQPYAVTYPKDYGKDPTVKWRLDVVLHGRDSSICEVKFLHQHGGDKPAEVHPYVMLEIFGRGNNAYRWAGESDVLEAVDSFMTSERLLGRDLLDPRRVVLRGFSMGGAGAWHLGLQRPDRWCVIGPGAGFTATRGYVRDLPDQLPDQIEKCLHIYDAIDYAENAQNVPVVAYAGDQDPQLQAARNIESILKPKMIPMTMLVAPGLKHAFPVEWQRKAESEYLKYAGPGKGRALYPAKVRFVTYTLKFPNCDWVEIGALNEHYRRAEVDAARTENGFKVTTANVSSLRLTLPGGDSSPQIVRIDGQEMSAKPANFVGSMAVFLERQGERWVGLLPQKILTDRARQPRKSAGLQGPIDDAFTDSFLCVRGTGAAWHSAIQEYADADLKRFQLEWSKFMRGELPVKDDANVTDEDIATKHLILFGDPSSNSLIGQVVDRLPITWTKDSLSIRGKSFDSATHLPALVYPSPLNMNRYVVLNSGHTFHASDFMGTNALLYPRLGDFAILKPGPTAKDRSAAAVAISGLFDDYWK